MNALPSQATAAPAVRIDYGSRFINERGIVLWDALKAVCPTAHLAAQYLCDEDLGVWDRTRPDEINAILIENGIEPDQIAALRADVVAVAHHEGWQAYRREKFRCDGRMF